jgi:S-adenosylmethionine hydrolase
VSAPVITFLSDYGYRDEFVGVCHGVIARRCPAARIIDLTHGIARHDVRAGALALRAALPYTPAGVHLAVVDPGVGGARRAIALATQQQSRFLVGPDNGLLLDGAALFGGVREAVDVGASSEALSPVSATFHGRDIFAPVAAALADGSALAELGRSVEPGTLVELASSQTAKQTDTDGRGYALVARVLSIDGYGNVALNATGVAFVGAGAAAADVVVETAGERTKVALRRTFGDVEAGELVAYVDSRGALALAVNGASAAERLGLSRDDVVTLRFR